MKKALKKDEKVVRRVGLVQASAQDSRSGEMPFFVTELHGDWLLPCVRHACAQLVIN